MEEPRELRSRQHPLVNERAGRQASRSRRPGTSCSARLRNMKASRSSCQPALASLPGHDHLTEGRASLRGRPRPGRPASTGTSRHARTERPSSSARASKRPAHLVCRPWLGGQERYPGGIGALRRELYAQERPAGNGPAPGRARRHRRLSRGQLPWPLGARAGTGWPGPSRPSMAGPAMKVGHKGDPTGVVFELGPVKAHRPQVPTVAGV